MTNADTEARRAYWARMMEDGYDFMQEVQRVPVEECSEGFAFLPAAVAEAGVDVTLSARPHVGGMRRLYYLREGLVEGFLNVARTMNRVGWVLHVEDAYRSPAMQRGLALDRGVLDKILARVTWELNGRSPDPDLLYRRVTALVATAPCVATHMSGSALDISVMRRDGNGEVDRGAPYLEMSELTPMASPFVGREGKRNRETITDIFRESGFAAYPPEFWHYSRGDAYDRLLRGNPQPAQYGPVNLDLDTGRISPIEDPAAPLVTIEAIRRATVRGADCAEEDPARE